MPPIDNERRRETKLITRLNFIMRFQYLAMMMPYRLAFTASLKHFNFYEPESNFVYQLFGMIVAIIFE